MSKAAPSDNQEYYTRSLHKQYASPSCVENKPSQCFYRKRIESQGPTPSDPTAQSYARRNAK